MEAEGLCVTHGNLSDRAWPELTKQFLSIVMGAHQRRMSAAKIAKVLADIGAATSPEAKRQAAADLTAAARVGALNIAVAPAHPLAEIAAAHDHVDNGPRNGRVLLAIPG